MAKTTRAAFILTVCLLSNESVRGGSYVAFTFSDSAIIVAADSRVTGGDLPPDDKSCKIIRLGEHAFFASYGVTSGVKNGKVINYSNDIARDVFTRSHDFNAIAPMWGEAVIRYLRTNHTSLDSLKNEPNSDRVATGLFGADQMGGLSVRVQYVELSKGDLISYPESVAPQSGSIHGSGYQEYVAEYNAMRSHRALALGRKLMNEINNSDFSTDRDAYNVRGAVEAVIEWSGDVRMHGPVDILVLRKGQVSYWVKHKPNCQ